jgi:hypothetical protein
MRFWHGLGYTPIEELETLSLHAEKLGFFGITLGDRWVTAESQVDRYNQGGAQVLDPGHIRIGDEVRLIEIEHT